MHFTDSNLQECVTGYNVYRASDAGLPRDSWDQVALDTLDLDETTPEIQWTDASGDTSPTGAWFYDVVAYNNPCGVEGPQ